MHDTIQITQEMYDGNAVEDMFDVNTMQEFTKIQECMKLKQYMDTLNFTYPS